MGYLRSRTKVLLLVFNDPERTKAPCNFYVETVKMLSSIICDAICSHNLVFTVNSGWLGVTTELSERCETKIIHKGAFMNIIEGRIVLFRAEINASWQNSYLLCRGSNGKWLMGKIMHPEHYGKLGNLNGRNSYKVMNGLINIHKCLMFLPFSFETALLILACAVMYSSGREILSHCTVFFASHYMCFELKSH